MLIGLRKLVIAVVAIALMNVLPASALTQDPAMRVYFGTYTRNNGSKGIYASLLNLKTGELSKPELAGETVNPSFLAIAPGGKFLYAVGEGGEGAGVSAFAIGDDGKLTLLNRQDSGGKGPAHISLDVEGKNALVANYGSGSIACLPIETDGKLKAATSKVQHEGSSVNPSRQKGPHAHSIYVDRGNRFVVSADLGLDKVLVYQFDPAAGKLTPNTPPSVSTQPGAGPRHFAFHPGGKHAFVINEMNSTLTAFSWDAEKGVLAELQTLPTLPAEHKGNSTAEVVVHPSGKFVYGSNRGHDSIAGFGFDAATGKLSAIGHTPVGGKTPRNFNIDPSGQFLIAAHQGSDTVQVFRIDQSTGGLTPVGGPVAIPMPVCVKFLQP